MNKRTAAIFAVTLTIAVMAYYGGFPHPGASSTAANLPAPDQIRTARPERKDFELLAQWMGTVENKETVSVRVLETGKILSVDVQDGKWVEQSAPLFTLGGTQLDSRLAAARDAVASVRQRVTLAEEVVRRKRSVVQEMLSRKDELNVAEAELATLQTQLQAATDVCRRLQDATRIRAPMTGIFTQRVVSPGQDVQSGEVLARIVNPKRIRIAAALLRPDRVAAEGQAAAVRTPGGDTLRGTVTRVLPECTPAGAAKVWIEGDELWPHLRPGETVGGHLLVSVHQAALAIPETATVRDQDQQAYAFVKMPGGYRRQSVSAGLESQGWVEVTSGIRAQDEVVAQGAYELLYRDFGRMYKVAD